MWKCFYIADVIMSAVIMSKKSGKRRIRASARTVAHCVCCEQNTTTKHRPVLPGASPRPTVAEMMPVHCRNNFFPPKVIMMPKPFLFLLPPPQPFFRVHRTTEPQCCYTTLFRCIIAMRCKIDRTSSTHSLLPHPVFWLAQTHQQRSRLRQVQRVYLYVFLYNAK